MTADWKICQNPGCLRAYISPVHGPEDTCYMHVERKGHWNAVTQTWDLKHHEFEDNKPLEGIVRWIP